MEEWTLWPEGSHVRMSVLPVSELVSLEHEVDFSGRLCDLQVKLGRTPSSWRMCQDFYPVIRGAISQSSSLHWPTQGIVTSSGECWTRSSLEYHSAAEESSLSLLLETQVADRYSLSARACEGILRRASRRGKALPKILEEALVRQASQSTAQE